MSDDYEGDPTVYLEPPTFEVFYERVCCTFGIYDEDERIEPRVRYLYNFLVFLTYNGVHN